MTNQQQPNNNNNLENINVLFVAASGNRKTGVMSQTYTSCNTCPTRCPFKNNGCYAEQFHCKMAWDKAKEPITNLRFLIKQKGATELIRHNVAGDIAVPGTSDINEELVNVLIDAYKGYKAYTYTHCTVNPRNIAIVKKACQAGFTINFSCESVEDVKKAKNAGVPAVLAVSTMQGITKQEDNLLFVKCPSGSGLHCNQCKACQNCHRKAVVIFEAHGNGKKKTASFLTNL